MDNFDTESNCSYQSDSLHSNASSLSGLSFYGNEFAELRHLINPSKYSAPYLDRRSTPKAELSFENDEKVNALKIDFQKKSHELNEKYKNDLQNIEKQIELKFHNKIDRLLRSNSKLEAELKNANSQIERLIKNSKEKNELMADKKTIDLEKRLHQMSSANSSLQILCANLEFEKNELDLQNKDLIVKLKEFLNDGKIKNASIQSLKQKISEQHIELQNCIKTEGILTNKLNLASEKLQQYEKSENWYKSQLNQYQSNKQICNEELLNSRNQIGLLNEKVSCLNIEISKHKNEIDQVRLQALKEKGELFNKLEMLNLNYDSLNVKPAVYVNNSTQNDKHSFSESNLGFYELTIEDLKTEISRIKINIQERDAEFDKLKEENCEVMAKCLILQKKLQQTENNIELLEDSKKELIKKLEYFKESEKNKMCENLHFRNRLSELEIDLKIQYKEKQSVENTVQIIRDQFLKFKQNYEEVKSELELKDKEILQLQKDKQKLFMDNNWTICELEKIKEKDRSIENLKIEILNFEGKIAKLTQKIRDLEFQILKSNNVINEKENTILKKNKELENHNTVIVQYKDMIFELENKINVLQVELKEVSNEKIDLEENFKIIKLELKKRDIKLDKALKNIEQLQNDQKNTFENMSIEKYQLLDYCNALEQKYNCELQEKDMSITNLNNKFKKLENDLESYVTIITDDQKVQILHNYKNINQNNAKDIVEFRGNINGPNLFKNTSNFHVFPIINNFEQLIKNFFDNFNLEELENTVEIRIKNLDQKLQKIKISCEEKMQKLQSQCGKDKIKELEVLLQVRHRDMQDKQKKMDRNYRTLLRKVKEHMKGRHSAEKQLKYLQDMYNSLSDEHNTFTLSLNSKECKIQTLENLCENYKDESEKLRDTILSLESDLNKNELCEKCLQFDQLKEKLLNLGILCEDLKQEINHMKNQLRCSEEDKLQLSNKVHEREAHNKSLQIKIKNLLLKFEENETLISTSKDLEKKCSSQEELVQSLSKKLTEKDDICTNKLTIIEGLNQELEQAKDKINFLSNEIKILSSDIQQKVKYSEELMQNKTLFENNFIMKNAESQNQITGLRKNMVLLQNEIERLKKDKFFLQRLSNDLKIALQSYVEHNKNLKDQLNLMTKEKQPCNGLPPNVLNYSSLGGKYDEHYINRLLEAHKAPLGKPLTTEIQGCLSKLREEIFSLQDQISRKNRVNHISCVNDKVL